MSQEKPLILLTGAAGRVARILRPLLRETYRLRLNDIVAVDDVVEGEALHVGDLSDPAVSDAAVRDVGGVVHLAGLVSPPAVSFEDTLEPNYRAVLNLLEACRRQGVKRFVFASSHHVLGMLPSDRSYDHREPVAPDGFYGLSKAFGEAACAMYAYKFGIATLVVRIGNADPHVVDGRRERLWTSARDLAQLVTLGLTRDPMTYEIFYGVSVCPDAIFPQEAGRLGYDPLDQSTDHRATSFRPLSAMGEADGVDYVGGAFAVSPT